MLARYLVCGPSLLEHPVQFGGGSSPDLKVSVAVGVLGDYAESIGAPLRTGRPLKAGEWGSPIGTAAVVNESFAARAWPKEDPLDKQFRFVVNGKPQPWLTVVGVVGDFAQRDGRSTGPWPTFRIRNCRTLTCPSSSAPRLHPAR